MNHVEYYSFVHNTWDYFMQFVSTSRYINFLWLMQEAFFFVRDEVGNSTVYGGVIRS